MPRRPRPARREDAEAIARIYNEGIEDRLATFETRLRSAADVAGWLDEGFPLVVVEDDGEPSSPGPRPRRTGPIARPTRGSANSPSTSPAPSGAAASAGRPWTPWPPRPVRRGFWKLVSRIFPENEASLALCRSLGFREVGVYRRHGKLDGAWRDVVIVELLLAD